MNKNLQIIVLSIVIFLVVIGSFVASTWWEILTVGAVILVLIILIWRVAHEDKTT